MQVGKKGAGILGIELDGWEVLLAGAAICFILRYTIDNAPNWILYVSIALFALWLITVVITNTHKPKKPPGGGSGGETAKPDRRSNQ